MEQIYLQRINGVFCAASFAPRVWTFGKGNSVCAALLFLVGYDLGHFLADIVVVWEFPERLAREDNPDL